MSRHKKIARRARRRKHVRRHAGAINANTKVYSASAWWRDNDPSMQVIALSAEVARKKIGELMDEAAEREEEMYESVDDAANHIAWSGVHAFSLGALVSDREMDEAKHELKVNGYYYPEMP